MPTCVRLVCDSALFWCWDAEFEVVLRFGTSTQRFRNAWPLVRSNKLPTVAASRPGTGAFPGNVLTYPCFVFLFLAVAYFTSRAKPPH